MSMNADVARICAEFCAENNLPKEKAVSLYTCTALCLDWYYDYNEEEVDKESERVIEQAWKEYVDPQKK